MHYIEATFYKNALIKNAKDSGGSDLFNTISTCLLLKTTINITSPHNGLGLLRLKL